MAFDGLLLLGQEDGLHARGTARHLRPGQDALPEAVQRLLAMAGPGALVAGAMPFDPGQDSYLFATDAAHQGRSVADVLHAAPTAIPAALRRLDEGDEYAAMVAQALRLIDQGVLSKVVLARQLAARTSVPVDPLVLARRLHAADPSVLTFLLDLAPVSGRAHHWLVGATPELLVERHGAAIRSHPLAGSTPRGPDRVSDEAAGRRLLQSEKDRREHALVVEYIADLLAPLCIDLTVASPALRSTATMWHLGTEIGGMLKAGDGPSAAGLAALLHPTPAVGGVPRAAALQAIRDLEGDRRGFYGGAIGWVDAAGDGAWHVTLRCAEISGCDVRLHAGAGIVAGSDPAAELAETDAKFGAMLRALALDMPVQAGAAA
ncbi:isochorismate synthase [Croceibacterium mercuriale]|uniref:isochorismate synthase n=1 Tax=Croceibacterium mercuriale TaxID=1572751 RepID=UPI0006898B91|nr:isochorismate synthase [Croceibacterium mercuriale]